MSCKFRQKVYTERACADMDSRRFWQHTRSDGLPTAARTPGLVRGHLCAGINNLSRADGGVSCVSASKQLSLRGYTFRGRCWR
eukprot:m.283863 g.283863  ORF g.283863 m.283863 type:complete len:83 (-) comp19891_c0_seq3:1785-2033(-)